MALVDGHLVARQGDVDDPQVLGIRPQERRQVGYFEFRAVVIDDNHVRSALQWELSGVFPAGDRTHDVRPVAEQPDDAFAEQWM